MTSSDLAFTPATELAELIRARKLSPVELTRAVLDRIERLNPIVNAFCTITPDVALAAAREAEQAVMKGERRGPLHGVPFSIKDLHYTKDIRTMSGSFVFEHRVPDVDPPVVRRLRQAGGILLGKTTTPEFGWKGVSESPLTGITHNPWKPGLNAGASSAGAGVGAAAGYGPLHQGSDGAGSIRMPAHFCGVYGLKPTYGRVPQSPLAASDYTVHLGPLTRTVADAALMLNVITKPDLRDWYAIPYDAKNYLDGLEAGVRGWKIAFSPTMGGHPVDPEIAKLVAAAAQVFRELGATVEEVEPEIGANVGLTFVNHWFPGAANALRSYTPAQQAVMDPGLCEVAGAGATLPLMDYLASVKEREQLGVRMNQFHKKWDLLLTPTLPLPAFAAGVECPVMADGSRWTDWTPFSYPFNLTRQPAATVPCGLTSAGLPAGLQIVGPSFGDAAVLQAARAFEKLRPFRMPAL